MAVPFSEPQTVNLDETHDWREAEYFVMVQQMREALTTGQWPAWLTMTGPDWFSVQLIVDGQPQGPPLAWPNALFIARWLVQTR